MKTSILAIAIVACALSAPIVSAQDNSAPTGPANSVDMDKQISQMQEHMKVMQQQMEKIRATTDPNERQKLMQEHMQTMQEYMKTMHGMGGPEGGPCMMGGPQDGPGGMSGPQGGSGGMMGGPQSGPGGMGGPGGMTGGSRPE